jgi:hypothetical protein
VATIFTVVQSLHILQNIFTLASVVIICDEYIISMWIVILSTLNFSVMYNLKIFVVELCLIAQLERIFPAEVLGIFITYIQKTGVAVSGTRPCVLREYVYVNG